MVNAAEFMLSVISEKTHVINDACNSLSKFAVKENFLLFTFFDDFPILLKASGVYFLPIYLLSCIEITYTS